jgi:hypothetical protein
VARLRVVSGVRGTLKSVGLEAPFVGRDRELRPEQGHLSRQRRRGPRASDLDHRRRGDRQVATGLGVLQVLRRDRQTTYWHRGRCLSYGEGVTYWALADMVRCVRGSSRTRSHGPALAKLREVVEEHFDDADERRFVEPRLAHLLGLEEESARVRTRGPVRRLAALFRAAGCCLPGGDALRGHAVGGCLAA